MHTLKPSKGFTLAEMLIALTLIGIISALLIPKLLHASNGNAKKVLTLQTAAVISQAYQEYGVNNVLSGNTSAADLLPQFNITQTITTGNLDGTNAGGGTSELTWDCTTAITCVRMHTGAYMGFWTGGFGGTTNLNSLWFLIDTDGSPSTNGAPSNPDNSIWLVLFFDGRIKTWSTIPPNTLYLNGANDLIIANPQPLSDPPWFDIKL